jgi:hypothetical protein
MNKYHLYLDESETHTDGKERIFCLAGIIVEENNFVNVIEPGLNDLKKVIWHDLPNPTSYILHEKDVRSAQKNKMRNINPEFYRFRKGSYSRNLYNGIGDLINSSSCKIVGSAIHMDNLDMHFKKTIVSHNYLIAFQIILENFSHFLESVNGVGSVFYESRDDKANSIVRMQFNQIKAMGSMYVNPYAMQKHIREIEFPGKTENNAGLQVADFVPNPFARLSLGKAQHKFNLYPTLRTARYDGGIFKGDRFGVKMMP